MKRRLFEFFHFPPLPDKLLIKLFKFNLNLFHFLCVIHLDFTLFSHQRHKYNNFKVIHFWQWMERECKMKSTIQYSDLLLANMQQSYC
jgi:hypothetical protein